MANKIVVRRDLKNFFPKEFSSRELIGKFIDYIMNNHFQPSSESFLNGYIGKKTVAMEEGDFYIKEATPERQNYQLMPAIVSKDAETGAITSINDYCNFIHTLDRQNCLTYDQNRLLSNTFWSWCPPINADMYLNYSFYYWVEEGPTPIELTAQTNVALDVLGKEHYTYVSEEKTVEFISGLRVTFKNDVNEEYNGKTYIVEGVGNSIILVDDTSILKATSSKPDYFIMERGCRDGNTWSRRNRWFHRSIVNDMSLENSDLKIIQASKPILCYNRDIELFNYGCYDRGFINILFNGKKNKIHGQSAFETSGARRKVQGVPLTDGTIILITGDPDTSVNNRLYQVTGTDTIGTIILQPLINGLDTETGKSVNGEGVTVINDAEYIDSINAGKYFYYKDYGSWGEWVEGQVKEKVNQTPLFNLYDDNKVALNNPVDYPNSTFAGNSLFDYITPERYGIEDTSKLVVDEDLDKPVITTGYGNYIFDNLLDDSTYTYTEYDVEKPYVGYKFFKMNNGYKLDSNGEVDDSGNYYLNYWRKSESFISQYVTTEITVTDKREYVEMESQESRIKEFYTKYSLEYAPYMDSNQSGIFVYLNGNLLNYGVQYIVDNKDVLITPNVALKNDDSLVIKMLLETVEEPLKEGYYYDLPVSLISNPCNEDILTIAYNESYDQMASIIESQKGFEGNVNGKNNYINTKQDMSLGTKIVQHSNPIIKTMMLNSQEFTNIRNVIEYVKRQYTAFKNKFRTVLETKVDDNLINENTDVNVALRSILSSINIGKEGLQPFYNNGVMFDGTEYYIPATPAYLGIEKSFKPAFEVVDFGTKNPTMLIGHDGSYNETYGDFRDSILFALEERIYESINSKWKDGLPLWNDYKYIPGKFRKTAYSIDEYKMIYESFFENWANTNEIDYYVNNEYDYTNPMTYNYSSCVDKDGEKLYGSYRSVYLYYYDTFEPHIKPWEMLGFGSKPEWWEEHYGKAPYTSENIPMWKDIENGYIADGLSKGYHEEFKREGLVEKYLPVDGEGNLLTPLQIGIINKEPTLHNASMSWNIGDMGAAETLWTLSSEYRFDRQAMMYMMRPLEWLETTWDTKNYTTLFSGTPYEQIIYKDTLDRTKPSTLIMHNELIDDVYVQKIGTQQWVSDLLTSENINITSYIASPIRHSNAQLIYRGGRYFQRDTLKVISDNYGVLPSQNYEVSLYLSKTNKTMTYSSMMITKVADGYMIDGYDLSNPYFNVLKPLKTGKKTNVNIEDRNVIYYNVWTDEVEQIKYKSVYTSVQDIFTIICGYGKYLERVEGWMFDEANAELNEPLTFNIKAEDFLRFVSANPEINNFILMNPLYEKLKIKHDGFLDIVGQYINGNWSIVDTNGNPIYNDEIFVYRHNGYTEISPKDRLIAMAKVNVSEYEHLLVFDNKTVYGDTLYDPILCVKTERLKLIGVGVDDWNGTLYAPGYIVDVDGADANLDKMVDDFRYIYDTDDVHSTGLYRDYVTKTIGYQKTDYMERMLIDDRNMFNFYKGMLREKGTRKSFDKLNRSTYIMTNNDGQLGLYENWAFKLGDFGYNSDNYTMEFNIDANKITQNPQIVSFTTKSRTADTTDSPTVIDIYWNDVRNDEETGTKEYWLKQLTTKSENAFSFKDSGKMYPTGGCAQTDEVDYLIPDYATFDKTKENIAIGEKTWVITDDNNDWNIYKRVADGFVSMRVQTFGEMMNFNRNYITCGDYVYVTAINLNKTLNDTSDDKINFTDSKGLMKDSQNVIDKTTWAVFQYNKVAYTISGNVNLIIGRVIDDTHNVYNDGQIIGQYRYNEETNKYEVYNNGEMIGYLDASGDIFPQFDLVRCKNKLPDITKISSCYIVDNKTDATMSEVQLYDPLQGIIPNKVLDEVEYISGIDPADYTDYLNWGDAKVGELWWDISKVKYLDYHQGDVFYRRENWGKQLPGSEIAIMEWTKSNEAPSEGQYVVKKVYNYKTANEETNYYFWVKNPSIVPDVNFRKLSAIAISNVINSPHDEGIIWMSPVSIEQGIDTTSSFIIDNFDKITTGSDFVVQINFKNADDLNVHAEWALVREGDDDDIPASLWTKMIDSLVGRTELGVTVPDESLEGKNRTGLSIRPMQSMFNDLPKARENMVDVINDVFNTRDVTTDTDVGTKEFEEVFTSKTSMPENADIVDEFTSSAIMKISATGDMKGKTILLSNDESYNGIWTYWKMNNFNDFTLLDYEKYDVEKYWEYKDLYYDDDAYFAQPLYTTSSLIKLETEYFNTHNVEVGETFKIANGGDWFLVRVTDVVASSAWKNNANQVEGYITDGIAYNKNNEEVGFLITEENVDEVNELYHTNFAVNDVVTIKINSDLSKSCVWIGYYVNKTVYTLVVARHNATVNLTSDLYDFLTDKSLIQEYENKLNGKKYVEYIDGLTKYEYLQQETETVIRMILDYFSQEKEITTFEETIN